MDTVPDSYSTLRIYSITNKKDNINYYTAAVLRRYFYAVLPMKKERKPPINPHKTRTIYLRYEVAKKYLYF